MQLTSNYQVLSKEQNPRSTSGLMAAQADPDGKLMHYKRIADPAALEREAQELLRAREVTRSVPGIQPIDVRTSIPDQGLLLTEHVGDHESLFNYFWNRSGWWSRRQFPVAPVEVAARLGRWLRVYHDSRLSYTDDVAPLVDWVAHHALEKLEALEHEAPRYLGHHLTEHLRHYLKRVAEHSWSWGPLPTTQIHGDLCPSNITVSRAGTLYILDFGDNRPGLAWEDLARLWQSWWGMTRVSRQRAYLFRPCLHALLREYGETHEIVESPAFRLFRCWNALNDIRSILQTGTMIGVTAYLAGRRLARRYRRWLDSVNWFSETIC
jgi:hypothetical protein